MGTRFWFGGARDASRTEFFEPRVNVFVRGSGYVFALTYASTRTGSRTSRRLVDATSGHADRPFTWAAHESNTTRRGWSPRDLSARFCESAPLIAWANRSSAQLLPGASPARPNPFLVSVHPILRCGGLRGIRCRTRAGGSDAGVSFAAAVLMVLRGPAVSTTTAGPVDSGATSSASGCAGWATRTTPRTALNTTVSSTLNNAGGSRCTFHITLSVRPISCHPPGDERG